MSHSEAWKPNDKTVIVAFDPSSPNIVAFRYIGDDVQAKLKRAFWVELQSRFGNLFFVRQEVYLYRQQRETCRMTERLVHRVRLQQWMASWTA